MARPVMHRPPASPFGQLCALMATIALVQIQVLAQLTEAKSLLRPPSIQTVKESIVISNNDLSERTRRHQNTNSNTNHFSGNTYPEVAENITALINEHPCFLRNEESCHEPGDDTPYDCMWCEYWCVFKQQNKVVCQEMASELLEFAKPKVDSILPRVMLAQTPTLITFYGSNLYRNSERIYNNVSRIMFDDTYPCNVIMHNETNIQCIVENIKTLKSVFPELFYSRVVYSMIINDDPILPKIDVRITKDYDENPQNTGSDTEEHPWLTSQTLVGLAIGALFCTSVMLLYINRRRAKNMIQVVERMVFLKNIRKSLIKKGLFVEYTKIQLKTKLGDGNFGEVYLAQVQTKQSKDISEVAIKKLRKGADLAKTKMFLTEGVRMSNFKHDRILSPLAITLVVDRTNQTPAIVLPIMTNGDLCRYLRKNKVFPIVKLLTFALQIAEGLQYLSSINVVHGDLAARNCLLDDNLEIKIGDFGLSREMYRTDYVTINDIYRPIRWMALECLTSKKPRFTTKSDVWSYGIVLWEIFTLGSYPYEEFDNGDLGKHLQAGYRLHKPLNCPVAVYSLMSECWSIHSVQRPSFAELRHQLSGTLADIVQEANGQTELAHSAIRDHFNYTSLAERFVQGRTSIASTQFSEGSSRRQSGMSSQSSRLSRGSLISSLSLK